MYSNPNTYDIMLHTRTHTDRRWEWEALDKMRVFGMFTTQINFPFRLTLDECECFWRFFPLFPSFLFWWDASKWIDKWTNSSIRKRGFLVSSDIKVSTCQLESSQFRKIDIYRSHFSNVWIKHKYDFFSFRT